MTPASCYLGHVSCSVSCYLHPVSYPSPIQHLIQAFKKLPGVGTRTAERFVFQLLKSGKRDVGELNLALKELTEKIKSCQVCWDFSDTSPCAICSDPKRNRSILCVVGESQDVQALEKIKIFPGLYHILRGNVSPEDPLGGEATKIPELLERIEKENIEEVILALNSSLSEETTMLFLENQIRNKKPNLRVSRLARGLPLGSDLEYADEITLESALKNRTSKK